MKLRPKDFDYAFDKSLVATHPVEPRSSAKLLVVSTKASNFLHSHFSELPKVLKKGDVLVVNTSRVIPARFYAHRLTGAKLEGLFLEPAPGGVRVWLKGKALENELIEIEGFGSVWILKRDDKAAILGVNPEEFSDYLWKRGSIPVPPYIEQARTEQGLSKSLESDRSDYQSVFSLRSPSESSRVSVAAPTASLHFDEDLLERLKQAGVRILPLKLYVSAGTFEPLVDDQPLDDQVLHSELVDIPEETWAGIQQAQVDGCRIIPVGTTSLRAIESACLKGSLQFETNLFVKPPFKFQVASGLITNFHWPKSSLLTLVATFLEAQGDGSCASSLRGLWNAVYQEALAHRYRLFSYGDGMLILRDE